MKMASHVAQAGNLLRRRLAVGEATKRPGAGGLPIRDTADYQSALRCRRSPHLLIQPKP